MTTGFTNRYMIEVPAKMWRSKVISKYTVPTYYNEDIDSILDYGQYGKYVYRIKISWDKVTLQDDIIPFNTAWHTIELEKCLYFNDLIDEPTRQVVKNIILKYWDCLVKEGAKRTIIGYAFGIDTGGENPVCCWKPSYRPYE